MKFNILIWSDQFKKTNGEAQYILSYGNECKIIMKMSDHNWMGK